MREEVVKAVEAVERSLEANYGKGAPVHGHMALLDKALRDQEAEIARLRGMLGWCYEISGADTNGGQRERFAERAVEAVRQLRLDYEEALDLTKDTP